jgi:Ser/Thr protein kinase RdoA (MazF antagonist)
MSSSIHQVHGMAGECEAAHWPPLTHAEVAALLALYPAVRGPLQIVWHSPRPLSAACLVRSADAMVFVKRHHIVVRSVAALGEEHCLMDHLRDRGIPIPRVLAAGNGERVARMGDWVYEVHARAAGNDTYRDAISWAAPGSAAHARTAGTMLARLHAAAAGYRAPQRSTHLLVARAELLCAADPLAALEAQLPDRPALAAYLSRRDWKAELAATLAPWHGALHERLQQQPTLWTHGDWHVSNLCWSGIDDAATVTGVLDFGLAAATFALFDLATAIERNAVAWLALDTGTAAARIGIALALVDGYRQVLPLGAADVHLLANLLPLVHLDFALSEVEYLRTTGHAPAAADVAYHTFLRGHAAWFATPAGRSLLAAIQGVA